MDPDRTGRPSSRDQNVTANAEGGSRTHTGHLIPHRILNPTRLPIPPPRRPSEMAGNIITEQLTSHNSHSRNVQQMYQQLCKCAIPLPWNPRSPAHLRDQVIR